MKKFISHKLRLYLLSFDTSNTILANGNVIQCNILILTKYRVYIHCLTNLHPHKYFQCKMICLNIIQNIKKSRREIDYSLVCVSNKFFFDKSRHKTYWILKIPEVILLYSNHIYHISNVHILKKGGD